MDLNTGIITVSYFKCHTVFNSHDQFFSNYEPSTVVSHLELIDNYSRTSFTLSYKPLNWHARNAPIVASLLKRVTSLLTRSRDPSSLLRYPSVYSRCLATNEARRCDAMGTSSRLGLARLCSALLCSVLRKHRFVYCCVIAGACFDVTVLAWRKYATIFMKGEVSTLLNWAQRFKDILGFGSIYLHISYLFIIGKWPATRLTLTSSEKAIGTIWYENGCVLQSFWTPWRKDVFLGPAEIESSSFSWLQVYLKMCLHLHVKFWPIISHIDWCFTCFIYFSSRQKIKFNQTPFYRPALFVYWRKILFF
jgi:hypothetical protein